MSARDTFGISTSLAALFRAIGFARAAQSQANGEAPAVGGTDGSEMSNQAPTINVLVLQSDGAEGDGNAKSGDERDEDEGEKLSPQKFKGMLTSKQIVQRRNGPASEDVAMITILAPTPHGPQQYEFMVPPSDNTAGAFTANMGDELKVRIYTDGRVAYVLREAFDIDLDAVSVPEPAMARFKEQLAKEKVEGALRVFKFNGGYVSEEVEVAVSGTEVTVRVLDFAYLSAHAYGSYDPGVVNPARELAVIEKLKKIDFELGDGYTIKFVAVSEERWLADQAAEQTAEAVETGEPAEVSA